LQQLEEASARARKQSEWRDHEASNARFREKTRWFLRARGVEQQADESLAGALARALEITGMELRRLLTAGIDPIHKYLTDRGVHEACKAKKAAETMPGG
jgi:hypothetical protein